MTNATYVEFKRLFFSFLFKQIPHPRSQCTETFFSFSVINSTIDIFNLIIKYVDLVLICCFVQLV